MQCPHLNTLIDQLDHHQLPLDDERFEHALTVTASRLARLRRRGPLAVTASPYLAFVMKLNDRRAPTRLAASA